MGHEVGRIGKVSKLGLGISKFCWLPPKAHPEILSKIPICPASSPANLKYHYNHFVLLVASFLLRLVRFHLVGYTSKSNSTTSTHIGTSYGRGGDRRIWNHMVLDVVLELLHFLIQFGKNSICWERLLHCRESVSMKMKLEEGRRNNCEKRTCQPRCQPTDNNWMANGSDGGRSRHFSISKKTQRKWWQKDEKLRKDDY